jgi:hypothetical protein
MADNGDRSELLERAKKRVEEIRGFYVHLGVYVIVNGSLFALNMITSPDTLWFYWPLLGWGIGLALHAFAMVTENHLLGPQWEDRKVHDIVEREGRRAGRSA